MSFQRKKEATEEQEHRPAQSSCSILSMVQLFLPISCKICLIAVTTLASVLARDCTSRSKH